MGKNIKAAVREVCLGLPEVEERSGHGMPDYRVRAKTFAMMAVNHHGDGRIALWVHSPPGAQHLHVEGDPRTTSSRPTSAPAAGLACTSIMATTGTPSRPGSGKPT